MTRQKSRVAGARVVITGLGAVSCLGLDLDSIAAALRRGRSGVHRDPERAERGFRSTLTGRVTGYDAGAYASRKQRKSMGQPAEYAVGAAVQAVEHARLDHDALRSPNAGVIVGNDSCVLPAVQIAARVERDATTRLLGSGAMVQSMASTVSMNLATYFGIRGAAWSVSAACASGAHALGQAFMLLASGLQDVVLCGGAQEINWQVMAAFDALGALATDTGDPAAACRPFDVGRTGLVPSGGAAMLVLETLEHARRRGAPVLAEVVGYGFSSDGEHLTQPNGDGAVRAITAALRGAGRGADEVEYINAHATGTPLGDAVEGRSILRLFANAHGKTPPVSSTKSMTGHECWMAGASEVLYTVLMMRDGFVAPNINLSRLDPELDGLDVIAAARPLRPRLALSTSFGFGGTNAAVLLAMAPESGA